MMETDELSQSLVDERDQAITDALDEVYAEESSTLDPVIAQIQALSIASDEEW